MAEMMAVATVTINWRTFFQIFFFIWINDFLKTRPEMRFMAYKDGSGASPPPLLPPPLSGFSSSSFFSPDL